MNVESSTTVSTTKTDTTSSSSSSASTATDGKAFKDELAEVQNKEATEAKTTSEAESKEATDTQGAKTSQENAAKQASNEKLLTEKDEALSEQDNETIVKSLTELNSKIATINDLKSKGKSSVQNSQTKDDDKINSISGQVIKMDNRDVSFFLSLTDNQQMTAQASQLNGQNNLAGADFAEVKSEATQKTVQVSQTLMDALNDSAKTNKPFRIDFGGDVAVVMKVDKDGAISANFIPGTAAVENYLKNNISTLRQSFEEQNLPYNELSYSQKRKDDQQEKQKRNKENDNE